MKNKYFERTIISILVTSLLLCCVFLNPAMADEPDMQEVVVSSSAGKNGYYRYNEETGEAEFVPPPESIEAGALPAPAVGSALIEESNEISPHWIVGDDNRIAVAHPAKQYGSTCLIIMHFGTNERTGTGWLINDTYVMTAGHVVYNVTNNLGYADWFEVYVGASGGNYSDYRTGHWEAVGSELVGTTLNEYMTKGIYDDWGIIKLDSPVTVNQAFLGRYPVNEASDMFNRTYFTQGYPGDLNQNVALKDRVMYLTNGIITGDRKRSIPVVYTTIDNMKGQSGSPVYSFRGQYGYAVEGILVAEAETVIGENCVILFNNYLSQIVWDLIG